MELGGGYFTTVLYVYAYSVAMCRIQETLARIHAAYRRCPHTELSQSSVGFERVHGLSAVTCFPGSIRVEHKTDKGRSYRCRPPLWSSGQSFWLQIHRSRVRSLALPYFLSSSGSGTGSTQPREVKLRSYLNKKVAAPGSENRD